MGNGTDEKDRALYQVLGEQAEDTKRAVRNMVDALWVIARTCHAHGFRGDLPDLPGFIEKLARQSDLYTGLPRAHLESVRGMEAVAAPFLGEDYTYAVEDTDYIIRRVLEVSQAIKVLDRIVSGGVMDALLEMGGDDDSKK